MNKELKNYLRQGLKMGLDIINKRIKAFEKVLVIDKKSHIKTNDNDIYVIKFDNFKGKISRKDLIIQLEELKKTRDIFNNLEEYLFKDRSIKIIDWRFLIYELKWCELDTSIASDLFKHICDILKKDSKDYADVDNDFRHQERILASLIDDNYVISNPDEFVRILLELAQDFLSIFSHIVNVKNIQEHFLDNSDLELLCRKSGYVPEEKVNVVVFNKKEEVKNLTIGDILAEEFKKYRHTFTSTDNISLFMNHLKDITTDELLLSLYENKAYTLYNSYQDNLVKEVLKSVYQNDYEVLIKAQSLNQDDLKVIIDEIYAIAKMYLQADEEDKLLLLKEFINYMIDLKNLVSKYTKKDDDKELAKVIYYTEKNELVLYEQLVNLRKDTYFDYYNIINKIINNNLSNHRLLGSTYREPVYYMGKENKVFYTVVDNIPVIICTGSFNDALSIVNSNLFKVFIDNLKSNPNLYLKNNDDNKQIISLLCNSKRVVRKLNY